jgi:hypothetical protein
MKLTKFAARLFLLLSAVLLTTSIGYSQAIITNGTGVYLGINTTGNFNVPNGTGGVTLVSNNSDDIGLYYLPVLGDGTAPGCLCEGWGVGVTQGATQIHGRADISSGGTFNLTVDSFTSTASTATSIVHLTSLPGLTVSQAYSPTSSPALFQDVVTITNGTSGTLTNVRYERVMDWDIPPTTFDEFVTIQGWPATNLIHTSDDGFHTPDPYNLSGPEGCASGPTVNVNFTRSGPCDHGADFVFDFGSLAAGASKTFTIFYGAAGSGAAALAALSSVGAEVYSLGQCNSGTTTAPPCTAAGGPATFIFGFQGVGGTPIGGGGDVPEPSSLILLGSGLACVAWRMRKKAPKA